MKRPMLFGKYCLLELISVGGMAEVFRAKPLNAPDSQRHLALKRILPNLAEDDEFISMFLDEARLAAGDTGRYSADRPHAIAAGADAARALLVVVFESTL